MQHAASHARRDRGLNITVIPTCVRIVRWEKNGHADGQVEKKKREMNHSTALSGLPAYISRVRPSCQKSHSFAQ